MLRTDVSIVILGMAAEGFCSSMVVACCSVDELKSVGLLGD
jgi:hypothetical protein